METLKTINTRSGVNLMLVEYMWPLKFILPKVAMLSGTLKKK
jgi:hypothetical protein